MRGEMFCSRCGVKNPGSAQFCYRCGAPMFRPSQESPTSTSAPKPKACPACGLTNPASASNCDCGYSFGKGTRALSGVLVSDAMTAESELKGVRGWLLLFCVIATILAPVVAVLQTAVKGLTPLVLASAGVAALSCYAGVSIWRVTTNALKWLKAYFVVQLGLGVLALLGSISTGSDPPAAAGGLFWVIVWFLYFHKSARVRLTYGRNL